MKLDNKLVDKTWGYELWFDNNELYCGKLLFVEQNKWSSKGAYHYHKIKLETFFIIEGILQLDYVDVNGKFKTIILNKYDSFRIEPGIKHRYTSVSENGCKFIEASTNHSDEDSYRTSWNGNKGIWEPV